MGRAHDRRLLKQWNWATAASLNNQIQAALKSQLVVRWLPGVTAVDLCGTWHSWASLNFSSPDLQHYYSVSWREGRGKESPDQGLPLPLWCKDSYHGHTQVTNMISQSTELGINIIGSHELVPASSSSSLLLPTFPALFLTSLSAPLPPQIPKGVLSRKAHVYLF